MDAIDDNEVDEQVDEAERATCCTAVECTNVAAAAANDSFGPASRSVVESLLCVVVDENDCSSNKCDSLGRDELR